MASSSATEEGLDLMQIYKVVVAARNNVPGGRNGPSVEIRGIKKIIIIMNISMVFHIVILQRCFYHWMGLLYSN